MVTSSIAMSPIPADPVVPTHRTRITFGVATLTVAPCQLSPWLPDFVQIVVQLAPSVVSSSYSVPMLSGLKQH